MSQKMSVILNSIPLLESLFSRVQTFSTSVFTSFHCSWDLLSIAIMSLIPESVPAAHPSSMFDIVLSNVIEPITTISHSFDLLKEIVRILKPKGVIHARHKGDDGVLKNLKLTGFVNVVDTSSDNDISFVAEKPSFEVGSSSKLSFGMDAKPTVWSLSDALVDEEVELVNEDDLLDEDDLIRPAAESLRVCGTTGKRKACKDCSCGLAEELASESGASKTVTVKSATSSCGSCYLGDAFRCASCPYLGMPAFKPGEKILLSDRQLNPDA
nr:EOG090X0FGQ [Ilyocryptus agilis]